MTKRKYHADNSQHNFRAPGEMPDYAIIHLSPERFSKSHENYFLVRTGERYDVYWFESDGTVGKTDYEEYTVANLIYRGDWILVNHSVEGIHQHVFKFPEDGSNSRAMKVVAPEEPVIELEAEIDEQQTLMYANVFFDEEHERWGVRSSDYNGNITPEFCLIDHADKGMEFMLKVARQLATANVFAGVSITADNVVIE